MQLSDFDLDHTLAMLEDDELDAETRNAAELIRDLKLAQLEGYIEEVEVQDGHGLIVVS